MRASRKTTKAKKGSQGIKANEMHISGAEGICRDSEISAMCNTFIERAMFHPRGKPDKIIVTMEEIGERLVRVPLLPVKTLECPLPEDAWGLISDHMSQLGISSRALHSALRVLKSNRTMRGASLISSVSGRRKEPDLSRGVRVSRLGIDEKSEMKLSRKLSKLHINNPTVKEALILASKVAFCKDIVAEVCISDDPDYTTGYIASRESGYLRVPNIKNPGDMHGGRIFFVKEDSNTEKIIAWLEKKPVITEYSK